MSSSAAARTVVAPAAHRDAADAAAPEELRVDHRVQRLVQHLHGLIESDHRPEMPFICSAQLASACSHSGIPAAAEAYLGLRDRALAGSPAQALDWPKFAPLKCRIEDSKRSTTDTSRDGRRSVRTPRLRAVGSFDGVSARCCGNPQRTRARVGTRRLVARGAAARAVGDTHVRWVLGAAYPVTSAHRPAPSGTRRKYPGEPS